MNFAFSDEQEQLREQLRRLVRDACPTGVARDVMDGKADYADALWRNLAVLGALGIGIPEELGGIGLGVLEMCVVAEEIGRNVAPAPFLSSRVLAAETLLRTSEQEVHRAWLPRLASGEVIACYASPLNNRYVLELDGHVLSGQMGPVPDSPIATLAIVAATIGGGDVILAVPLRQRGVEIQRTSSVDPSRVHGDITLSRAECTILAEGKEARNVRRLVERQGAVVLAFEQLGGADACLTMARDYAITRHAFGRPIGSYQAIKHKLADVHVKNTLARAHAYHGAWALETDAPEADLATAGARAACTEAFSHAAQENLQTHGGIGFTWEHDCHLYYRRARLTALTLGPVALWKERIVTQLERADARIHKAR